VTAQSTYWVYNSVVPGIAWLRLSKEVLDQPSHLIPGSKSTLQIVEADAA
jgi:hypothetical protein